MSSEECYVCWGEKTDPRQLPCGNQHTFCMRCVRGLVSTSRDSAFPCPVCRTSVKVPRGGASAFPPPGAAAPLPDPEETPLKFAVNRGRGRHRGRRGDFQLGFRGSQFHDGFGDEQPESLPAYLLTEDSTGFSGATAAPHPHARYHRRGGYHPPHWPADITPRSAFGYLHPSLPHARAHHHCRHHCGGCGGFHPGRAADEELDMDEVRQLIAQMDSTEGERAPIESTQGDGAWGPLHLHYRPLTPDIQDSHSDDLDMETVLQLIAQMDSPDPSPLRGSSRPGGEPRRRSAGETDVADLVSTMDAKDPRTSPVFSPDDTDECNFKTTHPTLSWITDSSTPVSESPSQIPTEAFSGLSSHIRSVISDNRVPGLQSATGEMGSPAQSTGAADNPRFSSPRPQSQRTRTNASSSPTTLPNSDFSSFNATAASAETSPSRAATHASSSWGQRAERTAESQELGMEEILMLIAAQEEGEREETELLRLQLEAEKAEADTMAFDLPASGEEVEDDVIEYHTLACHGLQ